GKLSINGGNLTFNGGEYDARINLAAGGDANTDQIQVSGQTNILGNSSLKVTGNGILAPGQAWDVIKDTGTSPAAIHWGFQAANVTLPPGVPQNKNAAANLYELSS